MFRQLLTPVGCQAGRRNTPRRTSTATIGRIATRNESPRLALNFLDQQPPDLGEVREALGRVVGDADRAGLPCSPGKPTRFPGLQKPP